MSVHVTTLSAVYMLNEFYAHARMCTIYYNYYKIHNARNIANQMNGCSQRSVAMQRPDLMHG